MRGSPHIEADGRSEITYLVTVMEIDVDKFADFQAISTCPSRLQEKIIHMWDTGMGRQGLSEFQLVVHQTTGKQSEKGFPSFLDLRPPRNPRE